MSQTLTDIIAAHPAAARVLERHRVDYCCGGQRDFDEACRSAGLDPDVLRAEIEATPTASTDVAHLAMGPAELVDHIEATHHAYLHEELGALEALMDKVVGVHGRRHRELADVAATYSWLRADLEPHLAKEEQVLFPMIRALAGVEGTAPTLHCGSIANPIRVMRAEHDAAGALLERLRTLTDDYSPPGDACASYRSLYERLEALEADTHLHVHKENNVLFGAAQALEASLGQSPG
jgi:regulator of cell morphogenesis and NO signaling